MSKQMAKTYPLQLRGKHRSWLFIYFWKELCYQGFAHPLGLQGKNRILQ